MPDYGCGPVFHQQLLSSTTPEVDDLVRLPILMGAVTARGRNGDSVGVVPISGRPGYGVVPVAVHPFHPGMIVV